MLKNIQIKIILIFLILGIIIITALGAFFLFSLEEIQDIVLEKELIEQQMVKSKVLIGYAVGIFSIISLIVGIFVAKVIIQPISKLIKSAEKIAKGEEVDIKLLAERKNKK